MTERLLPSAQDLTGPQYRGWACCWCGKSLLRCGGISAGIARGRMGAHVLDVEVYACPPCAAPTTQTPARSAVPAPGTGGAHRLPPEAPNHTRRTT